MTRFDLHVHTALSACAENVMSPRRILERAHAAGMNLLGITDHNASGHVLIALRLAEHYNLRVIPGMEVTSREDVHLLVFFDEYEPLAGFQALVDASLSSDSNLPDVFGEQVVYDEENEIVDLDDRLRQVGTSLGLDQLIREVKERGGVVIPAHVERNRFSLQSQLGFIDPGAAFDALEVRKNTWVREGHRLGDRLEGFPLVTGSDAHFIEDIGRTCLELPGTSATITDLMRELRGVCGP
jgi:3',5'-nucleoside bisphosphate phosphatase